MNTKMKSTLDERIAEAQVQCAKSAIASPYIWPQWQRLQTAKQKLAAAQKEIAIAQRIWDDLIAPAPPEWKKLAPDTE
jgi:hypothetical protein